MKLKFLIVALVITIASVLVGCQTTPVDENFVELTSLTVVEKNVKAGVPYEVNIAYTEIGDVAISEACFTFSGEGPFCYPIVALYVVRDSWIFGSFN